MNKEISFKTFALLTFQHAQADAYEAIRQQKEMLTLYKKSWHRLFSMDEHLVEKFFELDHEIHIAYKNFLEGKDE